MTRTSRFALLLALLLPLAACKRDAAPESATPAPAATPAAAAPAADAAATAPGAPADAAADTPHNGPIVPPQGPPPVEGTDYVTIAGGQPYRPLDGKVEVVEIFSYVCPACARFHPIVSAWERRLPADVRFNYVPASFRPDWVPYAKAFYVSESMGLVGRTHDALINAIHLEDTLPGEGDAVDEQAVANFFGKYGANPAQFLEQMNSFAVAAKVNSAKQFMVRSGADSTPTLVVGGKYRITTQTGFDDVLRVADHLIARERAALAGGTATPAATAPAASGTTPPAPAPAPTGG